VASSGGVGRVRGLGESWCWTRSFLELEFGVNVGVAVGVGVQGCHCWCRIAVAVGVGVGDDVGTSKAYTLLISGDIDAAAGCNASGAIVMRSCHQFVRAASQLTQQLHSVSIKAV